MTTADLSVIADSEGTGWHLVEVAGDSKTISTTSTNWVNWMFYKAPPEFYGKINSVTVYAKCYAAVASIGKAKIRIKTHDTVYEGDEQTLTTTSTYYSKTWSTNPNTSSAWTMDEVIDLQIGVALISNGSQYAYCDHVYCTINYDAIGTTTVSILRPNGAGDTTGNLPYPGTSQNYQCVDEESPNGDTDYVYYGSKTSYDLYTLPTVTVGKISWVSVTTVCRLTQNATGIYDNNYIKTHGTTYYHSEGSKVDTVWHTYVWFWRLNPNTNETWTQSEIDDLQAGIGLEGPLTGNRCTQVFVKVCHYRLSQGRDRE